MIASNKKIFSVILSFIVFFNYMLFSQQNSGLNKDIKKAEIVILAKSYKDSIVIRWAPSTAGGWIIANRIGYNIEKVKLNSDKPFEPSNYIKLNKIPLKPLPIEEWKTRVNKDNIFSAIAIQSIYGKSFIPKPLDENNLNALKNAADELTNRYSFALFAADNDAPTASAMGLRYVDREIKEGESFVYRVYVAEKTNEYNFDTAYIVVNVTPSPKIPGPEGLSFESGDGFITLKWEDKLPNKFSGYYIYRSEDGKNYKILNNIPLIVSSSKETDEEIKPFFRDTSTINYKKYYYRVFGINPFAELSEPSEIVAYSKDLTPPPPPTLEKPKQFSDEIILSWKLDKPSNDLSGFVVARSNNSLNNFSIITKKPLTKNTFKYSDKVKNMEEVYYSVGSIDTAGNISYSLPQRVILVDTFPPSVPTGLTGSIDSNGIVKLKWNMGPEWNILGYRVLRSNDPDHEFQQLTGNVYQDTVFVDTVSIKTLTKYVYYRIAAVNTRYQHSELSPILKIKRPDKNPPVEAVFKNVFVTDSSISLEWVPSTSKDLLYQKLFRRKKGETKWSLIDSLSKTVNYYVDKKVEKLNTYEYTILSFDDSGLQSSYAMPVMGKPYDKGDRQKVEKFFAKYDEKNNSVILEWSYNQKLKEKYWFVIYRGLSNNQLNELKAVESNIRSFTDKDVINGNTYFYSIVVMTTMGGKSENVTTSIFIPVKK